MTHVAKAELLQALQRERYGTPEELERERNRPLPDFEKELAAQLWCEDRTSRTRVSRGGQRKQ